MIRIPLKHSTKDSLKELKIPRKKKNKKRDMKNIFVLKEYLYFSIKGISFGCCYFCYFTIVKVVFYGNL